jgi:hypothetical protein
MRYFGLLTLAFAVAGCRDTTSAVADWPLIDGRRVRDLAKTADTTAILINDPADCLACGSPLGAWLRWSSSSTGREALVVLTKRQSADDARDFAAARLQVAGYLKGFPRNQPIPQVVLFLRGSVVDSAKGRLPASLIARRWITHDSGQIVAH